MKIERINDNQIRCTLTGQDLADRHLKLSELAYGTDKAKRLFRDMMQQASCELGFEADDIHLMIEAIPLSGGSIILNVTKVEYPEELDTRFSNFTDYGGDSQSYEGDGAAEAPTLEGADGILDLFRKIGEAAASLRANDKDPAPASDAGFIPLKDTATTDSRRRKRSSHSPGGRLRYCEAVLLPGDERRHPAGTCTAQFLYGRQFPLSGRTGAGLLSCAPQEPPHTRRVQ